MKKTMVLVAVTVLTAAIFVGCKEKNPVAGKKMSIEMGGGVSATYVFSETQFWVDGFDGLKKEYHYDKERDAIVYSNSDGSEDVVEMSRWKEVK